jgi:DNA polymerase III alpha subunit
MKLDKFGNPTFNETDIFNLLYQGDISVLPKLTVDITDELTQLENIAEIQFNISQDIDQNVTIEEFDKITQQQWFMPSEYYDIDVKEYCINKCTTDIEINRVIDEYVEFEKLNMIYMLKWCIYFVDVCNDNNIIWGVGRGSSVSSYILYLIGIHKINSIKYNLDWKEFLR